MPSRIALLFRVLLAALFASTCFAIWIAVGRRADFLAAFPGAERPIVYRAMLTVAVAGLAALAGLWRWQPWAIVLYGISAGAAVALDIVAQAPLAHRLAVLTMVVVVNVLIYANRYRFARPPARAARAARALDRQ